MEEIPYIQRTGHNKFQDYKYASEADIKRHVQAALVKHKVAFFPRDIEVTEQTRGVGKKEGGEGKEMFTGVRIHYEFVDTDSGEILHGVALGTGQDVGDKGLYKAITGCLKYIFSSTFLFETGDDPENDGQEKQESKPPEKKETKPSPQPPNVGQPIAQTKPAGAVTANPLPVIPKAGPPVNHTPAPAGNEARHGKPQMPPEDDLKADFANVANTPAEVSAAIAPANPEQLQEIRNQVAAFIKDNDLRRDKVGGYLKEKLGKGWMDASKTTPYQKFSGTINILLCKDNPAGLPATLDAINNWTPKEAK
jgi:hypothetical protein